MSDRQGFTVHLPALTELSTTLVALAERAERQGGVLGGVRADTGRADSDEAGRLGPATAAEVVGSLRDALRSDSGQVDECVTDYADADLSSNEAFLGLGRSAGGLG